LETSMNPKQMIEQVVNGKSVNSIIEVATKMDGNTTRLIPDNIAKIREIVEKHFQAMTVELEQAGVTGFNASVDDDSARIRFGSSNCY